MRRSYPAHVEAAIAKAKRLEYWTLAWLVTVVPLMALVVGSSQAMKTVWMEDMLGFIPPIAFLISERLERKGATAAFPYGFKRVNGIAFVVSAVALMSMGLYLLFEAVMTLVAREHPTVGTIRVMGRDIWLGWPMIAALLWSTIPSMILGRMKLPVARLINDKVLHTDAQMQKADWMTGIAAIAGVVGIGFGLWWADAAAAGLISFGIIKDGVTDVRSATAELADGAPRELESDEISSEAKLLKKELARVFPDAPLRLRETGRVIQAEIGSAPPPTIPTLADLWPGDDSRAWRLAGISFVIPGSEQDKPKDRGEKRSKRPVTKRQA